MNSQLVKARGFQWRNAAPSNGYLRSWNAPRRVASYWIKTIPILCPMLVVWKTWCLWFIRHQCQRKLTSTFLSEEPKRHQMTSHSLSWDSHRKLGIIHLTSHSKSCHNSSCTTLIMNNITRWRGNWISNLSASLTLSRRAVSNSPSSSKVKLCMTITSITSSSSSRRRTHQNDCLWTCQTPLR